MAGSKTVSAASRTYFHGQLFMVAMFTVAMDSLSKYGF